VVVRDLAVVVTDDPQFGIVAATRTQETFALMTTRDAAGDIAGVSGVVFTTANRESLTMYFSGDGRPTKAVVGNVVLVFSNYRDEAVDVAMRNSGGTVQVFRDMKIEPGLLAKLSAAVTETRGLPNSHGPPLSLQVNTPTTGLLPFLRRFMVAWSVGACITASVLSLASEGSLLVLATQACATALIAVIAELQPNNPYAFSADLLAGLYECSDFDLSALVGCVGVILNAARAIDAVARGRPEPPAPSGCGPMVVTPSFVRVGFHYAQFGIAVRPSCGGWTAQSNTSWIRQPIYSSSPALERIVTFTTECNPDRSPRTGSVTVAGRVISVEQVAFSTTGIECPRPTAPSLHDIPIDGPISSPW
jgi:hypothetical protein